MDRETLRVVWWIFLAPPLAYLLITHTWRVDSAVHEFLFIGLATASAMLYGITKA